MIWATRISSVGTSSLALTDTAAFPQDTKPKCCLHAPSNVDSVDTIDKDKGYAQNQKSAVVSAEAFCASFKLLMRQQHKEPRGCWHQSGAGVT